MGPGVRLNRFLAEAGAASRREADELIFAGRVTVNGAVVTSPAHQLDPARDAVKISGRRVWPQPRVYVLLNKPAGILSTVDDPQGRKTVVDLLQGVKAKVYPVGRLDANTTGVLLLTNDGDLALRLTHPRYGFSRTYHAKVSDVPSPADLRRLAEGVRIPAESGRYERTLPARARVVRTFARHSLLEISVQEGRHHQVRKMCAAIGHPVRELDRVKFGFLTAAGLPLGRWRYLNAEEIKRLKNAAAGRGPQGREEAGSKPPAAAGLGHRKEQER